MAPAAARWSGRTPGCASPAAATKYRRYACSNWQRNRALCAIHNSHTADKLERVILEHLAQYETDLVRARLAAADPGRSDAAELARVDQVLKDLDRELQADHGRIARGILDEDDFQRINKPRKERRSALEKTRQELADRLFGAGPIGAGH